VECGKDVVILLDSITRLARAYNTVTPSSGRCSRAVWTRTPCRSPSASSARRATSRAAAAHHRRHALVDTGSRMDEVIFEEFKGTGNMELVLDRKLADRRVFPAIDMAPDEATNFVIGQTRKEELAWGSR
jgi:transcription termination factor Rho